MDKSSRKIWVRGGGFALLSTLLFFYPFFINAVTDSTNIAVPSINDLDISFPSFNSLNVNGTNPDNAFDFGKFFDPSNVGGSDIQNIVWAVISLIVSIFIEVLKAVYQILQAFGIAR